MTTYTMYFKNAVKQDWYFGVYQKQPAATGLDSVAWQVRYVPPAGATPSTATASWTLNYGVALCNFDPNAGSYTGQEIVTANLGQAYQALENDGGPYIPGSPTGPSGKPNLVTLTNNTKQQLNMGFAVDLKLLAVKGNAYGGTQANFELHPSYYVSCFRDLTEGQVISSDVEIPPVEVTFGDYTSCTVTANDDGGTVRLSVSMGR